MGRKVTASLASRIAFSVAMAIAFVPMGARAQAPPSATLASARQHFQRGVKFYKDADFRSALVEFQEAYRLSPNFRLLFNIGQTFEELGDFAGAVKSFREYVSQGGSELGKARRAEVEKDLARLEGHVASVEIMVNETGADVTIEGERRLDLGKSPVAAPILLNGGEWKLRATKTGLEPAEVRVTVAGGDKKKVSLELHPPAAPPPPATRPPVVAPSPPASEPARVAAPPKSRTPFWIGVAVTGALGVGTGVVGVLALGQKSTYDKTVDRFGATPDEVASARTKTRTLAVVTDVLGLATVASAVVTVVLFATTGAPDAPRRSGVLLPYIGAPAVCPAGGAPGLVLGASGSFM